jgi:hypothetical protein
VQHADVLHCGLQAVPVARPDLEHGCHEAAREEKDFIRLVRLLLEKGRGIDAARRLTPAP